MTTKEAQRFDTCYDYGTQRWKYGFETLCKKLGKIYIEFLAASWAARANDNKVDWCGNNGGVPAEFLQSHVKPKAAVLQATVLDL